MIRIDDSKNGDAREVPMTERLSLLVQQLISGRPADEKIFPSRKTFERKWIKIRAAAGVPKTLLHDFGRTSARTKRNAGVPEGVIMELQGWKTAAMFRRYAIVNNDDKRKAVELVDLPEGRPSMTDKIRVVIVDDHKIMRDGLRRLLGQEADIEVVGEASRNAEALELVDQLKPDIITTDLAHPEGSGFELLGHLKYGETPVKAIVLTAAINAVGIIEAFDFGARGLVLKDSAAQVLLNAIRTVMAGGYWIHREPVSDLSEYMQTLVRKLFPPEGQA